MGLNKKVEDIKYHMMRWRRQLHAEPELAFEEQKTARFVTRQLKMCGIETHSLAGTGVIGVLHGRSGPSRPGEPPKKAIMLRADMDALPMQEDSGVPYASTTPGVHHACGHDGHTAMLLGAARALSENPDFDGTVYFVFQPAEERSGGADRMIKEGLFQKFPCDAVYGMHNYPGLPLGMMATGKGVMLAASDDFHVVIKGQGGHAAKPEDATDILSAAAEAVLQIKKMAAAEIPAGEPAVLSVCGFSTGGMADNVLPDRVEFNGTIRSFNPALQKKLKEKLDGIAVDAARRYNAEVEVKFSAGYPVLSNSDTETDFALDVARQTVGDKQVIDNVPRTMGVEDFAYMLQQKPGNFIALGTGRTDGKPSPGLHSAKYDFNDAALPYGATYWVNLVQRALPVAPPTAPSKPTPPYAPGM